LGKFIFVGLNCKMGNVMAVVKVDERGRMTIPKELGLREKSKP